MDTFIPNMTLANIMHSNSNILPRSSFFWYTHTLTRDSTKCSPTSFLTPFCSCAVGGNNPTLLYRWSGLGIYEASFVSVFHQTAKGVVSVTVIRTRRS